MSRILRLVVGAIRRMIELRDDVSYLPLVQCGGWISHLSYKAYGGCNAELWRGWQGARGLNKATANEICATRCRVVDLDEPVLRLRPLELQ